MSDNAAASAAPANSSNLNVASSAASTNSTPVVTETPAAAPAVAEAAKTAEALKAEIKKYKVKVDGSEEELTEDELVKHAQLGKAAQKRMQEAAEYRKQVNSFVDALRSDPMKVLSNPNLGIPADQLKKFAEQIINNEIEEMQKTPEQKEKEKLQKELQDLKAQAENDKKARDTAEFQRLQEQAAVQLDTSITEALEGSDLPKSPYTVKKMAEYMMLALQNDIDLSPKDLLPLIRKQVTSEIREMFGKMPEEALEEFLGKDNLSRLRKRNVQKAKAAQLETANGIKATSEGTKNKSKEETKKIPFKDFFKPF